MNPSRFILFLPLQSICTWWVPSSLPLQMMPQCRTLSPGLKCHVLTALHLFYPTAVVYAGICSQSTRRLQSSRHHFICCVCAVISLAGDAAVRLSANRPLIIHCLDSKGWWLWFQKVKNKVFWSEALVLYIRVGGCGRAQSLVDCR